MSYWGKDKKRKKQGSKGSIDDHIVPRKTIKINQGIEDRAEEIDPYGDMMINLNEDESEWVTYYIQTRALLWKNYLLFKRKTRILLFMTLMPIVIGYFLKLVLGIGESLQDYSTIYGKRFDIGEIPRCVEHMYYDARYEEPCISVGYGVVGPSSTVHTADYERYHGIMQILAKNAGFEYGQDVKALDIVGHNQAEKYFDAHQNKTQYFVMFCHEQWKETLEFDKYEQNKKTLKINVTSYEFDWNLPCNFEHDDHGGKKDMLAYYMIFNMTLAPNNVFTKLDSVWKKDLNLLSLKLGIDNAFLEYKARK